YMTQVGLLDQLSRLSTHVTSRRSLLAISMRATFGMTLIRLIGLGWASFLLSSCKTTPRPSCAVPTPPGCNGITDNGVTGTCEDFRNRMTRCGPVDRRGCFHPPGPRDPAGSGVSGVTDYDLTMPVSPVG